MFKLFMLLIGATPAGRHTEQHDVFFGIGTSIRDLIPQVFSFWPEARKNLHLDAWREVTLVDGYAVSVLNEPFISNEIQLYFINLGGYRAGEFDEFHYKMIIAATGKDEAIKFAKQTAFFRQTGFRGAMAHIDNKYEIDVDDIYQIKDILPAEIKCRFSLSIYKAELGMPEDFIHLGYFKPDAVDKWAPKA